VLAVLLFRGPEPVRAASTTDRGFPDKAAVKVVMKDRSLEYVTWPKVERMGGRAFVGGYRVNSNASVWLPIDEVAFIEEYANTDDMIKAHPNLAPKKTEPAGAGTTVKTPPDPPKKN